MLSLSPLPTNVMPYFDDLVKRINACTKCPLSEGRTMAVPGHGSRSADIMFIGEGPGFYEDREGLPFVGSAGHVLNKLLATIALRREDVFITNMVKCRPPNNRDPLPGELQACQPYLDEQLDLISPQVVVTLGKYSFSRFFPGESISKSRGKPRKWKGLIIYPMYHPAATLHNPKLRPVLENDFRNLSSLLENILRISELDKSTVTTRQIGLFE